jgi:hypothetical protein
MRHHQRQAGRRYGSARRSCHRGSGRAGRSTTEWKEHEAAIFPRPGIPNFCTLRLRRRICGGLELRAKGQASRQVSTEDHRSFQRRNIWGGEGDDDMAWWDPRVGEENRETAVANCVLWTKIFLLHSQ